MRVVAYILTVVGFTIITCLGLLGVVTLSERRDMVWAPLVAGGVGLAFYGPLVLGSLAAWWRLRDSSDSGRHYRLWRNVATAGTILGAVLVLVGGLTMGTPVWLLATIVILAFGLLLVAVPVGDRVRVSADAAGPRESDAFAPDTSDETRRVIRRTALTFAITLVVAAAAWIALTVAGDEPVDSRVALALLAFTFFAAGFACSLSSLRLIRRAREVTGHDFGRLRTIVRVVLKGKEDQLDETDKVAAAKYATLAPALLGTQLGFIALLYAGIGLQFTAQALSDQDSPTLPLAVLGALAIILAIAVPLQLIRIRRARAYASEHRELLTAD